MFIPHVLFIEAGHGRAWPTNAIDPGAVNEKPWWNVFGKRLTERQFTVSIATQVFNIIKIKLPEFNGMFLQGVGIDSEANVVAKTDFVNKVVQLNKYNPAKSFGVTIHVDGNYDVLGYSGYYQTKKPENKKFLGKVLDSMHMYYPEVPVRKNELKPSNTSRFGRLYFDDMKANYILVETGYMGNKKSVNMLTNQSDRIAEAIAHGILEHFRSL